MKIDEMFASRNPHPTDFPTTKISIMKMKKTFETIERRPQTKRKENDEQETIKKPE